ncbi:MAG: hypothetical protein WD775_01350 [Burkholderiales bacterium]
MIEAILLAAARVSTFLGQRPLTNASGFFFERAALPETAVFHAFTPAHLCAPEERVEVGSSLLIVGFPLGFHDTLHHMYVEQHADLLLG